MKIIILIFLEIKANLKDNIKEEMINTIYIKKILKNLKKTDIIEKLENIKFTKNYFINNFN